MLFVSFVRHWPGDGGGATRALPGGYAPAIVIELDDTCADVVGMVVVGCAHMFINTWYALIIVPAPEQIVCRNSSAVCAALHHPLEAWSCSL
jgi:hypothetical protein